MRRLRQVSKAVLGLVALFHPTLTAAQDGAALFGDNCAPCHNIGEPGGAAPDLRDVAARRQRAWLLAFVLDPQAVNKAAEMPRPEGLTRDNIASILDYIDRRSSEVPREPAPPLPEPVFTPDDVARGQALYAGRARLANGGPACLACHDAGAGPALGGGTLGPDLTRVATRLKGPKGTAAWLSAPPTPVMRSVFRASPLARAEVQALTAFFVERSRPDAAVVAPRIGRFVPFSLAIAVAAFVLIGAAWRGRLRPVRRALVSRAVVQSPSNAGHVNGFRSGGSQ